MNKAKIKHLRALIKHMRAVNYEGGICIALGNIAYQGARRLYELSMDWLD